MFSRSLLALLLLASQAFAELITISEGHYATLNLNADRDLLMTGGSLEYLNNMGGVATLDGGVLTGNDSRVGKGGMVIIRGSDAGGVAQHLETRFNEPYWGKSTIIWEGLYFRASETLIGPTSSLVSLGGFLLDGSFLSMNVLRLGKAEDNHFEFITHPDLLTDPTGDGDFDLADLNIVRNNFGALGSRTDGDIDGDGLVGLADLNVVRNNFGSPFSGGDQPGFSGVFPLGTGEPAPEPSSIILCLLLASCGCSMGLIRRNPRLKSERLRGS